jgi:hypothetical protein
MDKFVASPLPCSPVPLSPALLSRLSLFRPFAILPPSRVTTETPFASPGCLVSRASFYQPSAARLTLSNGGSILPQWEGLLRGLLVPRQQGLPWSPTQTIVAEHGRSPPWQSTQDSAARPACARSPIRNCHPTSIRGVFQFRFWPEGIAKEILRMKVAQLGPNLHSLIPTVCRSQ